MGLPSTPTTDRQSGSRVRLTPVERKHALLLRAEGRTFPEIAAALHISTRTASRVAKAPGAATTTFALRTLGVPKAQLREEQKEILLRKFREVTERACEWAIEQMNAGDPKAFLQVIQGIEKINVISGNAVGEGIGGPSAAPTHVDIKILLGQILGKPADGDLARSGT